MHHPMSDCAKWILSALTINTGHEHIETGRMIGSVDRPPVAAARTFLHPRECAVRRSDSID
jgi:hypothetical protein